MTLARHTPLKRTPFKAKPTKPLKRTRMQRRPAPQRKRAATPQADLDYMARVRKLPCAARHLGHPCSGRMTAHHAGKKPGLRIKSHVDTCIPLCWEHHVGAGIESFHGPFLGWTREQLRAWQDEQIERTRAALVRREVEAFPY